MEAVLPVNVVTFDEEAAASGNVSMMSADEYLSWVRHQADQLPGITRADIDISAYNVNQTKYMPSIDPIPTCPSDLLPSSQWENNLLHEFSELRCLLEQLACDESTRERKYVVPALKDHKGWFKFCFGDKNFIFNETADNFDKEDKEECEDDDQVIEEDPKVSLEDKKKVLLDRLLVENEDGMTLEDEGIEDQAINEAILAAEIASAWKGMTNVAPSTSLLLQFDQVMTQRVLAYQIDWLKSCNQISTEAGKWIFALLARIDKPLSVDSSSMIRDLYRIVANMRSFLASSEITDDKLAVLNTLITVSGLYFGQADSKGVDTFTAIEGSDDDSGSEEESDDDNNVSGLHSDLEDGEEIM